MKLSVKKLVSLFLAVVMTASVILTGCSTKKNGEVSRSAFIGMLGDEFGINSPISNGSLFDDVSFTDENYNQIQACAEDGVYPVGGSFKPNDDATLGFAIESAVNAIGISRLTRAGVYTEGQDIFEFYTNNIAMLDVSNKNISIDAATAEAIILSASAYDDNLVMPQELEVTLSEGVIEVESGIVLYDNYTGEITDGSIYNEGDILYVHNPDGLARGIVIQDINGVAFSYDDAEIEDTISELYISGDYDVVVTDVITAAEDDTIVYSEDFAAPKNAIRPVKGDSTSETTVLVDETSTDEDGTTHYSNVTARIESSTTRDSIHMSVSLSGVATSTTADYNGGNNTGSDTRASACGSFSVDITNIHASVHYEHKGWNIFNPKSVEARLTYDTRVQCNLQGAISKSIKLGQVDVAIPNTPITIRFTLKALLGADGQITVTYTTENVIDVRWKSGSGIKDKSHSDSSLDIEGHVTLTAEVTAGVHFRLGWKKLSVEVCNACVTTGAVAVATMNLDLLGDQPDCIDLLIYVPLRIGINQDSCIITTVGDKLGCGDKLRKEWVVWDSETSKIKLHWHWEKAKNSPDGWGRVDACTRGEGNEVETPDTNEDGNPINEYEELDFEELVYAFIGVESRLIFLSQNTCENIVITEYPDGVDESNIVTTSADTNVCTVSGLMITAVGPGSTQITISTADGTCSTKVSVTIYENYDVDFEPLEG